MYTLHIANKNYSSWSLRPWILMREKGIGFAETLHRFEPGGAWATFRAFSPTGKVPALHDGATVVWDSLAIVEYLAERHAGVWPSDAAARAWARSATAEMHSAFQTLRQHCSFNLGLRVTLNEIGPALQKDIDRIDELWSEGLKRFGGPFLAGTAFTAVDAFYAPVQFRIQTYGLKLGNAAGAYSQRVLALPGMADWQAAGLAEDFRDPEHDEVVRRFGRITADLRVKEA
ncbi:MAG: glutathione S-transferase family protein [Alphaproteobacteria bacterium]|jgi:glutathione S-transferase